MVRFMEASVDLKINAGTVVADTGRLVGEIQQKVANALIKPPPQMAQRFRAEADLRMRAEAEAEASAMTKREALQNAAAERAIKFRQGMELRQRAVEEATAKAATNRAAAIDRNAGMGLSMLTGGNPIAMNQAIIASNTKAGHSAEMAGMKYRIMAMQASYGLQDVITVLAGGGGFQQAMIGASNNLGAMFTMMGGIKGAAVGLGVTLGALSIQPLYEWFTKTAGAAERLKEQVQELQRELGKKGFLVGMQIQGANAQAAVQARRNQVGFAKADAKALGMEFGEGKFANLDEEKALRGDIDASKTQDAGIEKGIVAKEALMHDINKNILQRHRDVEIRRKKFIDKNNGLFGAAAVLEATNPFVFTGRSGVTTEMSKAEHDAALPEYQRLHDEVQNDKQKLIQNKKDREMWEAERKLIAPEVKKERHESIWGRLGDFERDLLGKNETGNEFNNRRQAVIAGHQEHQDRINRETVGLPGWRNDLSAANQAKSDAAWRDIAKDETMTRSRFMRGMEAHQKGTGSVHAVEDKLSEDLQRAEKLFANDPAGLKRAKGQAYETAHADTQRIINANRPRGGQFFGIEEYSKHLMSQIAGGNPDEKQIADNTLKAAEDLDQILQKMKQGFVIGAN